MPHARRAARSALAAWRAAHAAAPRGDDGRARRRAPARCRQPRHAPQRRQVGLHDEIAVALLPARRRVARHRLHVDVVGEQIVAAVRLLVGAVEEVLGLEALADQPALHVGEADHDRVDLAGADGLLQLVQREISGSCTCTPNLAVKRPAVSRGPPYHPIRGLANTLRQLFSRCSMANSSSGDRIMRCRAKSAK